MDILISLFERREGLRKEGHVNGEIVSHTNQCTMTVKVGKRCSNGDRKDERDPVKTIEGARF